MTLKTAVTTHELPHWNDIFGVRVGVLGWDEGIERLNQLTCDKRFAKIGFFNAHSANIAHGNEEFTSALNEFLILPDGIGVDVASQLLYGEPFPANLNGTDFVPAFLVRRTKPMTVGLIGTTKANADAAADAFSRLAPQHRFVVVRDGFFKVEEEQAILDELAQLRPDVLLVAMGVPRQELWIARNITADHCTLPIAVGALLDFYSGSVHRAPNWMRRLRIEWVYRLLNEPARLWRRYMLGNPIFLIRVFMQKFLGRGRRA